MPKYYSYKIAGYFLYFTSKCIIEAFHVHASDGTLREEGSAKLFVKSDGSTRVMNRGRLTDRELRVIQQFIADNYEEMYLMWSNFGGKGYFRG
ncbi:MAG: DUF4160 domain-containing protein [Atopobiaceae bacterium]